MKKVIELSAISKNYYNGKIENVVLKDISLDVFQGEFLSIMGKSGSGKTTLLNIMGAIDNPSSGEILINNKNIAEFNDDEKTIFRRDNIGFVFQSFNLVPILNVYENIALPLGLSQQKISDSNNSFINEMLCMFELEDKKFSSVVELSGGQQQKVAIARALSTRPNIILADEPTGNLDQENGLKVMEIFKSINKKFGQTIVMITHDTDIARTADKIIEIRNGSINDR